MPRRKNTSCHECHTRHLKCDQAGTGICSNCRGAGRKCTRSARIVFRDERGANVGIVRNKEAHDFAYSANQDWVSSSDEARFMDETPTTLTSSGRHTKVQSSRRPREKDKPAYRLLASSKRQQSPTASHRESRIIHRKRFLTSNRPSNDQETPSCTDMDLARTMIDHGMIEHSLERSANRDLLHYTYFQLHPGDMDDGIPYFLKHGPNSASMSSALDAIALLYIGSKYSVPELAHEAQRRYTLALGHLRRELSSPGTSPATVFSTIHIMQTCELFQVTSDTNATGLQHHALGNVSLMDKVFESAREYETWQALSPTLTAECRVPFSLWLGLARRKRLKTHELFWSKCGNHSNILRIAMSVPGVIEAADEALKSAFWTSTYVLDSIAELIRTQDRLHLALEDWYPHIPQPPYSTSSSNSFETSLLRREDIDGLPGPSYHFHNLGAATTHLTYWTCLLITQIARIDAFSSLDDPDLEPDKEIPRLVDEANEYARRICKTMAYCTLSAHGFAGKMNLVGPLALICGWCRREQNTAGLKWCEGIASRLEEVGLASPVAAIPCT